MHKKYIEKILRDGGSENVNKIGELFSKTMDFLKDNNKKLYDEIECYLYEMTFGKKLTEEMAANWINSMKPHGMKWTKEQTDEVLRKYGLNMNEIDFWAIMNAMYNDYGDIFDDNVETFIKLTRNFIKDEDAVDGKVYEYWKYVTKH